MRARRHVRTIHFGAHKANYRAALHSRWRVPATLLECVFLMKSAQGDRIMAQALILIQCKICKKRGNIPSFLRYCSHVPISGSMSAMQVQVDECMGQSFVCTFFQEYLCMLVQILVRQLNKDHLICMAWVIRPSQAGPKAVEGS